MGSGGTNIYPNVTSVPRGIWGHPPATRKTPTCNGSFTTLAYIAMKCRPDVFCGCLRRVPLGSGVSRFAPVIKACLPILHSFVCRMPRWSQTVVSDSVRCWMALESLGTTTLDRKPDIDVGARVRELACSGDGWLHRTDERIRRVMVMCREDLGYSGRRPIFGLGGQIDQTCSYTGRWTTLGALGKDSSCAYVTAFDYIPRRNWPLVYILIFPVRGFQSSHLTLMSNQAS